MKPPRLRLPPSPRQIDATRRFAKMKMGNPSKNAMAVALIRSMNAPIGRSLQLVLAYAPYSSGTPSPLEPLHSNNNTGSAFLEIFDMSNGWSCIVRRTEMDGLDPVAIHPSTGALIPAADLVPHPLEAALNLSSEAYSADLSNTYDNFIVIDENGKTAGFMIWTDTATYGTELYYFDGEHRPFLMADMNPGPDGIGSGDGIASLSGNRYLCFRLAITSAVSNEPVTYDLRTGAWRQADLWKQQ